MDGILTDRKYIETINDLQKRVAHLESARQPQLTDWEQLNPTEFSYRADNILSVAFDPTIRMNLGDKIRLTQGGTEKDFFITESNIDATGNYISIYAGNVNTYTNTAIESIYFSKAGTPDGHDLRFLFTPIIEDQAGVDITSNFATTARFSISNNQVVIELQLVSGSMPASKSQIVVRTGIKTSVNTGGAPQVIRVSNTSTIDVQSLVSTGSASGDPSLRELKVTLSPLSGGNFTSGNISILHTTVFPLLGS